MKVGPFIESEMSEGDNVKCTCALHEVSKPPTTQARKPPRPPELTRRRHRDG